MRVMCQGARVLNLFSDDYSIFMEVFFSYLPFLLLLHSAALFRTGSQLKVLVNWQELCE